MVVNYLQIIFIFLLICLILVLEMCSGLRRHILTQHYYQEAFSLAKKKNKKLMVIGDPCTGNVMMWFQRLFPNTPHGDVTIDLYGCHHCNQGDINNLKLWKQYGNDEFVILESATLSFAKDISKILPELKRISGGDFFSAGGTTSVGWKYLGSKLYSQGYQKGVNYMIYPFSPGDKYYQVVNLSNKNIERISF